MPSWARAYAIAWAASGLTGGRFGYAPGSPSSPEAFSRGVRGGLRGLRDEQHELALDLAQGRLLLRVRRGEACPRARQRLHVAVRRRLGLLGRGLLGLGGLLRPVQLPDQRVVGRRLRRGVLLADEELLRVAEVEGVQRLAVDRALVVGDRPGPDLRPQEVQLGLVGGEAGQVGGDGLLRLLEAQLGGVVLLAEGVELDVVRRDLGL